ncbi:MAG: helix-hairpin-helix domain-containing protein [Acidimicrobiia bacterium]
MGYVFNEIFWWILGALVIGFLLGWLFWKCRMWLSGRAAEDQKVAELTALADSRAAELGDLRVQLDERSASLAELTSRAQSSDSEILTLRSRVSELEPATKRVRELEADVSGLAALRLRVKDLEADLVRLPQLHDQVETLQTANSEIPGLRTRISELEGAAAAAAAAPTVMGLAGLTGVSLDSSPEVSAGTFSADDRADEPELDMDAAAAVLGRRIRFDDLTVVEGIGPKIAELIEADGIGSWRSLARVESSHLKGLLDDAGPRFQMHDPGTWPEQAGLLADGRWEEFKELCEVLDGGVRVDGSRAEGAGGVVGFAALAAEAEVAPDLDGAFDVLGFRPNLDDLKMIEGIGPAIEKLMNDAGISTWRRLSGTDPAVLSDILNEAGPRFRIHDPSTWPRQAGLLADGMWDEFRQLTDNLKGGRE